MSVTPRVVSKVVFIFRAKTVFQNLLVKDINLITFVVCISKDSIH